MRHAVDARPIEGKSLIRTAVRAWALRTMVGLCTGICGLAVGLSAQPVRADTAGCTVVLCLANPAGWAAVEECVAPVTAYFRSIRRKFRPPTCSESGATFSFGTRVIGMTQGQWGIDIPITETVLVMRNSDGTTQEFGGF
jgi:hypothetical protein